ncbi:MAG TPA: hypothetical protein ACFYEK_11470 [Candidatus Wunengus sp. YC60]|uniref:hypothetical protein n=1 Tax=Candidatus Wunengus sp. YC60 TaxID=3367697 RepID=UPI0040258340
MKRHDGGLAMDDPHDLLKNRTSLGMQKTIHTPATSRLIKKNEIASKSKMYPLFPQIA